MKLNIVGGAYKHPSVDVNAQRCVNMFMMDGGAGVSSKDSPKFVLVPTAGMQLLTELDGGPIRCLGSYGGYIYAVAGASVYKIEVNDLAGSAEAAVNIGTITTSTTGVVYMAANTSQIMWTDGSEDAYIYTPSTGVFTNILSHDADFPGAGQVVYIDSYFIVNEPGSSRFFFSASNNGLSWDPLAVATAESAIDDIVGLGVSKDELWVYGSASVEIWYNAANLIGVPFSPRTGMGMRIGCGAAASIVELDETLIWLDNRGHVVQSAVSAFIRSNNSGYDLNIISTEAFTAEILGYNRIDDAIAMGYSDRGHLMWQITFPTDQKTWVFDQTTKSWHERSTYNSGSGEDVQHLGQFAVKASRLYVMGGNRSGKLYLEKSDVYKDDDEYIRRVRVTAPMYEPDEKRRWGIDKLRLQMETGGALQSGQGSDPQMVLKISKNGAHTWGNDLPRSIGAVGKYNKNIDWNRLGISDAWVFYFSTSDPIPFSIIDAFIRPSSVDD